MADIPGASVKMNDVEISANAPVSESLMLKIGANINQNIDDIDSNTAAIASNDADILALQNKASVETDNAGLTTGIAQTFVVISTFSATPELAFVYVDNAQHSGGGGAINGATVTIIPGVTSNLLVGGSSDLQLRINGSNIEARYTFNTGSLQAVTAAFV